MNEAMTAGEFQALTGLSAKALRLYAERNILSPESVDPGSGFRRYGRSQLRHGMTVDLLRRAQVPLSELAAGPEFSFARWRGVVEMRRALEDFYLAVAERVAGFEPAAFVAQSCAAEPLDWVGVVVDVDVPDGADDRIGTFAQLAVDIPAVGDAFFDALAERGLEPAQLHWTAAGEPAPKPASMQLILARPGRLQLDRATREFLEERVGARTGCRVRAMAGVLPPRLEITFPASADASSPVEEAACGYLCQLAFEHHVATHHLTAISPTPRQVIRGSSWSDPDVAEPVSVFDVHPPAADTG